MWHLVQHDPGETVHLGTYEDYKSTPDTSLGQWVNNNLLSAGCRYQFGFES